MSYAEFFLNSKSSIIQFELIEISHVNFSKVYRIVNNSLNGLSVTLETGSVETFDFYPVKLELLGSSDDLDYGIKINFGDLGEVLPTELDLVLAGSPEIKPDVIYRVYRSDDLNNVLFGPIRLEIESFSFDKYGSTFIAKGPTISILKTGTPYSIKRFPMLRGLL